MKKIGILLFILFVVGIFANNKTQKTNENEGGEDRTVAASSSELVAVKESCAKLSKTFGSRSGLTSAQKDDIWEREFVGKSFEWKLKVIEVTKLYDGTFDVSYTCEPVIKLPPLIKVNYPAEMKKVALGLKENSVHRIKGILREYETAPPELENISSMRIAADILD